MSASNNDPRSHQTAVNIPEDTTCFPLHKALRLKEDPEPVTLQIMKSMKPFPIEAYVLNFS